MQLRCSFDAYVIGDMFLMVVDRDEPLFANVTNDTEAVIAWLNRRLDGGIGFRRIIYSDSYGNFAEIMAKCGKFTGFKACTQSQQAYFISVLPLGEQLL
ncbi:TPA: hypothetical protein I8273_004411 [Aeromonas hydrophila]|nr:hypothetical protein [Aeromonas hydrophila]HAT2638877.1 hypothetical protein [Aeromonas hydrophila]HAT3423977.1 hypothetical protein [Aeromonas hydrophila]HAT3534013.1 hypothetical protein [Aeromonas hydrophila]